MLKAHDIVKIYGETHTALTVLDRLNFGLHHGEFAGLYGVSGSGKSTFLHIMGGLDQPSSGSVLFEGADVYSWSDEKLASYRNKTIGFVFQFYHLLPEFTALENVMMPPLIAGETKKASAKKASEVLELVGLEKRMGHSPGELSGGEQQRVAIARAVVMRPKILLADEPTGNLDSHTGQEIMKLLVSLNKEFKMGIIMVTHDKSLVSQLDRKFEIKDGKIYE